MKYCTHCGNQLLDEAAFCPKCGCPCEDIKKAKSVTLSKDEKNVLRTIAFIVSLIVTVALGILIIPLAWNIPFTLYINKLRKNEREHSVAMDVCILIFQSMISGVLLLVDNYTD